MNDIAKNMAERIRNAAGGSRLFPATDENTLTARRRLSIAGDTVEARSAYVEAAAAEFERTYGVSLDAVTDLFVPKNDMLYAAAEQGIPIDEFTNTLGSQLTFKSVADREIDLAGFVIGENHVKLALAEFAAASEDWTFTDGYAVSETDGSAFVIAPAFDETLSTWQFSAFSAPCSKDAFLGMTRTEKAAIPSADRIYGDISDCARMHSAEAAPAAMRM